MHRLDSGDVPGRSRVLPGPRGRRVHPGEASAGCRDPGRHARANAGDLQPARLPPGAAPHRDHRPVQCCHRCRRGTSPWDRRVRHRRLHGADGRTHLGADPRARPPHRRRICRRQIGGVAAHGRNRPVRQNARRSRAGANRLGGRPCRFRLRNARGVVEREPLRREGRGSGVPVRG